MAAKTKAASSATRVGCRKVTTTPVAVAEPEQYTSIVGIPDPVPLRYFGAKCPECAATIQMGSAFLNHDHEAIEFWRCGACGGYAFEDYPGIGATRNRQP